jgi:sulfate adenylyltransferase subunit 2
MPSENSHLRTLEAESIYILREVTAEFAPPALLYSIGKDSSVLLRLVQKAFFPARPPFPLLHVNTTFRFREMIEFRDRTAREAGLELIVHTHPAAAEGVNPFRLGTEKCCHLLKTRAVGVRSDFFDLAAAERVGDVTAQQLAEGFEF